MTVLEMVGVEPNLGGSSLTEGIRMRQRVALNFLKNISLDGSISDGATLKQSLTVKAVQEKQSVCDPAETTTGLSDTGGNLDPVLAESTHVLAQSLHSPLQSSPLRPSDLLRIQPSPTAASLSLPSLSPTRQQRPLPHHLSLDLSLLSSKLPSSYPASLDSPPSSVESAPPRAYSPVSSTTNSKSTSSSLSFPSPSSSSSSSLSLSSSSSDEEGDVQLTTNPKQPTPLRRPFADASFPPQPDKSRRWPLVKPSSSPSAAPAPSPSLAQQPLSLRAAALRFLDLDGGGGSSDSPGGGGAEVPHAGHGSKFRRDGGGVGETSKPRPPTLRFFDREFPRPSKSPTRPSGGRRWLPRRARSLSQSDSYRDREREKEREMFRHRDRDREWLTRRERERDRDRDSRPAWPPGDSSRLRRPDKRGRRGRSRDTPAPTASFVSPVPITSPARTSVQSSAPTTPTPSVLPDPLRDAGASSTTTSPTQSRTHPPYQAGAAAVTSNAAVPSELGTGAPPQGPQAAAAAAKAAALRSLTRFKEMIPSASVTSPLAQRASSPLGSGIRPRANTEGAAGGRTKARWAGDGTVSGVAAGWKSKRGGAVGAATGTPVSASAVVNKKPPFTGAAAKILWSGSGSGSDDAYRRASSGPGSLVTTGVFASPTTSTTSPSSLATPSTSTTNHRHRHHHHHHRNREGVGRGSAGIGSASALGSSFNTIGRTESKTAAGPGQERRGASQMVVWAAGSTPIGVSSFIRHVDERTRERERIARGDGARGGVGGGKRAKSGSVESGGMMVGAGDKPRRRGESYAALLVAEHTLSAVAYDPHYIDDPELRTGKHRTVMALPGWMGSVIQYVRPSDLKKELNDQFRLTHPNIDESLTLSQIRNLKKKLVDVSEEMDLDLSCVAQSFVYFEKLILKDKVNKGNRRLVAAICLLLALKANSDEFLLAMRDNDLSSAPPKKGLRESRETKYARLLEPFRTGGRDGAAFVKSGTGEEDQKN
ncbi:CDK5 and ABL1 enzyme substrate 1 [Gonapodya sp. JEL0774]|nr:CDK5 and ABL1 enzyme substrate 1 [Gonapodya sp. JEL0774]